MQHARLLRRCLADGTPFDVTFELDTARRTNVPFRLIGEAERNDTGDIVRANGALQDVTELVAATRRAQEAARHLAQTPESMADAVYILDENWVFTCLNQRAGDLLPRDPDEPRSLEEFHYPPLETWFAVDAYPTEQGPPVYFRDITQAHAARAALERQAMLLDLAQDAIIVRDLDHHIAYWNASAERIYAGLRTRPSARTFGNCSAMTRRSSNRRWPTWLRRAVGAARSPSARAAART